MNYQKIYDQIIEKAKKECRSKEDEFYYEAHHILPKFLGGEGKTHQWKWHPNLVLLTAREHFLCHWLLARIYPSNRKAVYTFYKMCNSGNQYQRRVKVSSRIYKEAKELFSKSDKTLSQAARLRRSEIAKQNPSRGMLGKSHSSETIEKIKQSNKGKKRSDETRKKMSESKKGKPSNNKGNVGKYVHSEETKEKMKLAIRKKRISKPRGPYKKVGKLNKIP